MELKFTLRKFILLVRSLGTAGHVRNNFTKPIQRWDGLGTASSERNEVDDYAAVRLKKF